MIFMIFPSVSLLALLAIFTVLVMPAMAKVRVAPSVNTVTILQKMRNLAFTKRKGTPADKTGKDLQDILVAELEAWQDVVELLDTDAAGDSETVDLTSEFDNIEWVEIESRDLSALLDFQWDPDQFLLEFSDLSGPLTIGETLTGGTSGATLKLIAFKSPGGALNDYVQVRLLAGTPVAEIWTGGTSAETFTSTDGGIPKTRWISARVRIQNTGADHASETDLPCRWRAKGTKVAS